MEPGSALLIVDVQNDFCPGGSLAVPEGDLVVPVLNRYIDLFREQEFPVFASRDWHPDKTSHFKPFGGIWPVHCVKNSAGAAFHPDLQLPPEAIVISKGSDPERDDYSAFQGVGTDFTPFVELLRRLQVNHIYVGGLATDYCVKETVLEGIRHGLRVTLLEDAIAAVNLTPDDGEQAITAMISAGAGITSLSLLCDDY